MATFKVQFRRGTTAEHTTFTGAQGEITYDTETNQLVLHDGVTPGGHRIPLITDVPTDLNQLTDVNDVLPQLMPTTTGTWYGDRAFWSGGEGSVTSATAISYVNLTTPGNAANFGNLQYRRRMATAVSDSNRAVVLGHSQSTYIEGQVDIEYFATATLGDAAVFGVIGENKQDWGGASDGLYGIAGGGISGNYGQIFYIVIQIESDASIFGDLKLNKWGVLTSNDSSIALFAGGQYGSYYQNGIEKISFSTQGTATDHGFLRSVTRSGGGCGNDTISLFVYGREGHQLPHSKKVDYLTTATGGTASAAGELAQLQSYADVTNNGSRAATAGGRYDNNYYKNTIEYIDFSNLGNVSDFGDLQSADNSFKCATSGNL